MKKLLLFIALSATICGNSFLFAGEPIRIIKETVITEPLREVPTDLISASLDGNTVTITFSMDLGPVDVFIETLSGDLVTSSICTFTPDNLILNVSGTGAFVLTIETRYGTFTGQFTIN